MGEPDRGTCPAFRKYLLGYIKEYTLISIVRVQC